MKPFDKYSTAVRFAQEITWRAVALIALGLAASIWVLPQTPTQTKPSPTPRRPLPKPVSTARGFDQFAQRDASIRLIAAGATRGEIESSSHLSKGEAEYNAGHAAAAVAELQEAIKENPRSEDPHYVLGLALTETRELKAAIEEFKKVLELTLDPDLKIFSLYNMGNAYSDLGEYQNAIDCYKEAIRLDDTLSKPHNNLGLAYAALGKLDEAAAEFAEAVRLQPDNGEAHYNLGVAYVQTGKNLEAGEQQRILMKLNLDLATRLKGLIKK